MAKKEPSTFENSSPSNYQQSEKKYSVRYRFNGSMEIYVGTNRIKFEAHKTNPVFPSEYSDGIPESIVNHPDFQSQKKYFSVTQNQGG